MTQQTDVFRLTRELIDVPSVTGEEWEIGNSLAELLQRRGYEVEVQEVASGRANVIATTGAPPPSAQGCKQGSGLRDRERSCPRTRSETVAFYFPGK